MLPQYNALMTCSRDNTSRFACMPRLGPLQMLGKCVLGPQFPGTIKSGKLTCLSKISGYGTAPGQLKQFSQVALDHQGNFIVADPENKRIQVLKPDGTFLRSITLDCEVSLKIAVTPKGTIFARSNYSAHMSVYQSHDGARINGWWDHIETHDCTDIAAGFDGSIMLLRYTDSGKYLDIYDADGNLAHQWSFPPDCKPKRIAVDPVTGHIAVGNMINGSSGQPVHIFDRSGQLQKVIQCGCSDIWSIAFDAAGTMVVSDNDGVKLYTSDGNFQRQLERSRDLWLARVAVDADGRIIVSHVDGYISVWG